MTRLVLVRLKHCMYLGRHLRYLASLEFIALKIPGGLKYSYSPQASPLKDRDFPFRLVLRP